MYPVQVVSGVLKPKRDNSGSGQRNPRPAKPQTFGTALEKAAEKSSPAECYTVTYDRRSRLQTYYYQQPREYTF